MFYQYQNEFSKFLEVFSWSGSAFIPPSKTQTEDNSVLPDIHDKPEKHFIPVIDPWTGKVIRFIGRKKQKVMIFTS